MHPECAARITSIWELLHKEGVAARCTRLPVRTARAAELELAHTPEHVEKMLNIPSHSDDELLSLCRSYNSLYLCRDSLSSALLSAGGVLAAVDAVVRGAVRNAVAVVDPHLLAPHCCLPQRPISCVRAGAAARPPCRSQLCDGLLPVQQRRDSCEVRTAASERGARARGRLGCTPWCAPAWPWRQRHTQPMLLRHVTGERCVAQRVLAPIGRTSAAGRLGWD